MLIAYHYLMVMSVFLIILYALHTYRSALQGMGDTVIPMVSGMVEFVMRVSAAIFLPRFIGQKGGIDMADHVSCGILMKQIGDEMQKRADNKMRSWDMTMAQAGALLALNDAPEKQLSMKQLEKVLCIAQSTTAGIISRLEQKGLVEGYADAEDKRIKLVRITKVGIDRVLETKRDMTQAEEMLLSGLTETEREILYSLLKKVKDSLK